MSPHFSGWYCSGRALRPHFFDLLDYVTRRSEKLRFQKKNWRSSGEKQL